MTLPSCTSSAANSVVMPLRLWSCAMVPAPFEQPRQAETISGIFSSSAIYQRICAFGIISVKLKKATFRIAHDRIPHMDSSSPRGRRACNLRGCCWGRRAFFKGIMHAT